jgi:hypothetical protein
MEQMMQSKRIIYSHAGGGIGIVIPAANSGMSIDEIAAKDVPAGRPYRVVDVADIPSDRSFRAAWESDFSKADGHGADDGVLTDIAL